MNEFAAADAIAVVGLGFGDEGKGATVDWLAAQLPRVSRVVRFNGGAQAAHNVVTPDGTHHTFSQFGSATLLGVPTYLAAPMLVEPVMLAAEADQLARLGVADPLALLTIHPDALVTTAIHVAANRAREDARGDGRHGSCGKGIGETRWYDLASRAKLVGGQALGNLAAPAGVVTPAIRVRDCLDRGRLIRLLDGMARAYQPLTGGHGHPAVEDLAGLLVEFARAVPVRGDDALAEALQDGTVVLEGAQGVLLDESRGFHPHTTWSDCLPDAARNLLAPFRVRPFVVGVTRTYQTRHGAGPLPTEDAGLTLPERHNGAGHYQGAWRVGHLDLTLARYAAGVCGGLDALAVTHLDAEPVGLVDGYQVEGAHVPDLPLGAPGDLVHQERLTGLLNRASVAPQAASGEQRLAALTRAFGAPVLVTSDGPNRSDRCRRASETWR